MLFQDFQAPWIETLLLCRVLSIRSSSRERILHLEKNSHHLQSPTKSWEPRLQSLLSETLPQHIQTSGKLHNKNHLQVWEERNFLQCTSYSLNLWKVLTHRKGGQGLKCSVSHRNLWCKTTTSAMHSYPCVTENIALQNIALPIQNWFCKAKIAKHFFSHISDPGGQGH